MRKREKGGRTWSIGGGAGGGKCDESSLGEEFEELALVRVELWLPGVGEVLFDIEDFVPFVVSLSS